MMENGKVAQLQKCGVSTIVLVIFHSKQVDMARDVVGLGLCEEVQGSMIPKKIKGT